MRVVCLMVGWNSACFGPFWQEPGGFRRSGRLPERLAGSALLESKTKVTDPSTAIPEALPGGYSPRCLGECRTKRLLDLALVCLSVLFWLPLLTLLALAVTLESRGSAWYGHGRIGYRGKRYTMWKLRTMVMNSQEVLEAYLAEHPQAVEEWIATQKLKDDPRITRIGRWLRRFSLDELPQIFNVLTGEMSLVGPRPIYDPVEVNRWGARFQVYQEARPGLTGLWQVSGRNDTTYEERIALDMRYIRGWSLGLDLRILARTFGAVLSGKGAY